MTGSATDPSTAVNAAGYSYNWTVTGPNTTLAGTGTPYSFTPEYGGTYTVSLAATDQLNKLTSTNVTSTVTVTNVAPTASFSGLPTSSPAGTVITLTGSATDPSTAVNTAGYTYNWTVTGPSTTLSGTGTPYSFTPEYGGTYTVSLTATDQLNKLTSKAFTSTFSVTNVTPTASFTGLPSSSPSGTAITLTASATDPSTAVNNKGYVFNWSVSGPNTNLTGTGATYTFIPEYGGSYTVTLTATDQLNELTSAKASSTTVISNVAPSPSFTGLPTSSPCGTAIVLTGTATDPSTADTAAGFTFSWTVTGPGTVTFTGSSSTASPKFTFTPIVGGKYSVLMTATDSDKLSGSTTQAFTVNDIAPSVLTLSAPSSVSEAATFSTSATFSDPDPTVTHTALWTWGDGTTSAGAIIAPNGSTPGSVTGSHLYSIPGAFTVTLTVTGSDSLTGKATAQITTNRSIILLDPTSSGALSLSGNSSINIPGSVFVNSKSSTAVVASGNATVKASGVFIVGGDQVSGNASLGTVTKGSTAIVDPLASLPVPTAGTTQTPVNLSGNSTETINPGDYCQISVSGNAVLTMNAGVYIITGGGLHDLWKCVDLGYGRHDLQCKRELPCDQWHLHRDYSFRQRQHQTYRTDVWYILGDLDLSTFRQHQGDDD